MSSSPPLLITYSTTSKWPFPAGTTSSSSSNPLRIAVLDSSFNPPSRAHYALATYTPEAFDAHLLLLSSKNVDKVPGPGDTSLEDRIAMMEIMAKHMNTSDPKNFSSVAVGSLAAATFAEKAPIIQDYLQASPSHSARQEYTLIFFIGFDTVTRLFMPKYYDNSEDKMHEVLHKFFVEDKCEVICAKRPVENVAQQDVADQEEESFFKRPEVAKYVEMGKVTSVDIDGTVGISSTKIRHAMKQLGSNNPDDSETELEALIQHDILAYCREKNLYFT
ncbi:Nucleotidylyl transferase [Cystobasidium minutum MCA 4210]|uniref:Nucleotidylyl transferase n=1 Tax=Cystobasidium minutum MCA 4210 TaxID=1397322 RepID=UPI0034CD4CE4|eukprot:jgi/Rhomi1/194994/gm1.3208_g